MSVLKKFAGQTMIYGVSTIVARLLYFIMTPLYVNKYTPAAFGVFTNLYSWASMINTVLAFGMETTYFRYLQKVDKADRSKVFNNSFILISFLAFLFLCSVFFFSRSIGSWLSDGGGALAVDDFQRYVKYFAVILTFDALCVIPFARLRIEGRPVRFGCIKLINIFTMIILNLLFILLIPKIIHNHGALGQWLSTMYREGWIGYVFISNMVASALTFLLLIPQIKGLKLEVDKALLKNMLIYSFPILVANISFIINENLDKILIPLYLPESIGERQVGIYGAVAKLAMFLSIFIQAFRLGAEPFFFSHAKNENAKTTYAIIMQYFVIAMMIVMLGITANIDWLKYFIKGGDEVTRNEYWSGLFIVPLLLFNYVLLGIYINLSVWYKLSDQTRYGLYISGIGAIITIIANYYLIPRYSYVGAAIVTLMAYLTMVILSFFWGQKHYPIPYNLTKIILYLCIGVILSYLSYFVFNHDVIIGNGLVFLFLIIIATLERKQLLALLRRA